MSCIIEFDNVCYYAQNKNIVKNISYKFEKGSASAIAGPSGCGKSTLLKLAAGLFAPSKGKVFYKGSEISRMGRLQNMAFRKEAAFVFQDSALWANMNLLQILELPLRVHFPSMRKTEREKKIEEVLSEVGYKKNLNLRPASLSMGEQKIIAFARAIIQEPALLFLDEHTESLDDVSAERLINLTKKFKEGGRTIIFVSHNINNIKTLADSTLVILEGSLFSQLGKKEILNETSLTKYFEDGAFS